MGIREYPPMSESEYLAFEAQSPTRHEYVAGEVFAKTGTTMRHNAIAINLVTALRAHLKGSPCRAFISDVRVRVQRQGAYYYPDIVVNCADAGLSADLDAVTISDPVLIIEVLSSSTEAIDRREKLIAYRTLASLIEYVLVSTDRARVEVHRRDSDGKWVKIEYAGDEPVALQAVELNIAMRSIYEDVPVAGL